MKLCVVLSIILIRSISCIAQGDTIRVATYNLLNYGNSANKYASKNLRLQPVLAEIKPSLQCFNEVSTAVPGLLDTLLQVMPYPSAHGPVHNTVGTTQLDGLFWRIGKFHLLDDTIICSEVRDIVAYDLYYDYPELATFNDTIWLTIITAHLKSSNAASDRSDRAGETQKVSAYLSALNKPGNVIMLGDFNFYASSEIGYQNLTNPANPNARLNDPINRPGSWDNNASFGDIHTQSPRLPVLSDGGASGGMDSRFDFVLVSDAILNGSKGIRYVPGSYAAFGNDGQHYGKSITDLPVNTAVSPAIAQALYEGADHLPVFADLAFTPPHLNPSAIVNSAWNLKDEIVVENPFRNSIRIFEKGSYSSRELTYQLVSVEGKVIQAGGIASTGAPIGLKNEPSPGIYFLHIADDEGSHRVFRLTHL